MIGFFLVMFWVFVAIFGSMDMILTHDPLSQVSGMKNKVPGTPLRGARMVITCTTFWVAITSRATSLAV